MNVYQIYRLGLTITTTNKGVCLSVDHRHCYISSQCTKIMIITMFTFNCFYYCPAHSCWSNYVLKQCISFVFSLFNKQRANSYRGVDRYLCLYTLICRSFKVWHGTTWNIKSTKFANFILHIPYFRPIHEIGQMVISKFKWFKKNYEI